MATLDTYIRIRTNADGSIRDFQSLEGAVEGADSAVDDLGDSGEESLGLLDSGVGALTEKMGALAGPAAIGAVAGGLFKMAETAADVAVEAGTVATALELTVEEASRLNAAFGKVGLESNDIVDIALQINDALADDAELAELLGVAIGDTVKPAEALKLGIDNWDFLTAQQRSKAFGEEGVRQIARLVSEGESLDEILAGVSDLNIVDEDQLRSAQEFQELIADVQLAWQGVALTVGGEVIEATEQWREILGLIPGDFDLIGASIGAVGDIAGLAISPVTKLYSQFEEGAGIITGANEEVEVSFLGIQEGAEKAGSVAVDEHGKAALAAEQHEDAVGDLEDQYDRITDNIDREQAWADLNKQLDETEEAAALAFQAAAEGAEDASEKISESEDDVRELKAEVNDYAREIGELPPEVITKILSDIDQGSYASARALLARPITVPLYPDYRGFNPRDTGPGGTSLSTGSTRTTNITVNYARTVSPRQLEQNVAQWNRING